jgi:hypothetical protein
MKAAKYHLRLDVRGAIRNKSFSGFQHDDGRSMTKDEAFEALCDLLGHMNTYVGNRVAERKS